MPLILFVDDLQWADGDSAEVLFDMLSPPRSPRLLLLGTYRSDEADDSSFLTEWNRLHEDRPDTFEQQHLTVAPLTDQQCVELVALDVRRVGRLVIDLIRGRRGLLHRPQLGEAQIRFGWSSFMQFDSIRMDGAMALSSPLFSTWPYSESLRASLTKQFAVKARKTSKIPESVGNCCRTYLNLVRQLEGRTLLASAIFPESPRPERHDQPVSIALHLYSDGVLNLYNISHFSPCSNIADE